jgi:RNA polymerase sigma-70 factor (ECF subfamily)
MSANLEPHHPAAAVEPGHDLAGPASADDLRLVEALRAGDEAAFVSLVDAHHASLVRLAMVYVSDRAVAEEVAQETWIGVLRGLDRFEGRSSLKTWIFRILTNRAKTRGQRESRSIPFSALASAEAESDEPAVDPDRFLPPDHAEWPGHWASPLPDWGGSPEKRLLSDETLDLIRATVELLPPAQRQVITLRDIDGWGSHEVCDLLEISEANQRVLLHRARSKVRQALERHLVDE